MKFYLRMKPGKYAHKCWWSLSLSAGRRTIAHPHWSEGLLLIQEEERGDGRVWGVWGASRWTHPEVVSAQISQTQFPQNVFHIQTKFLENVRDIFTKFQEVNTKQYFYYWTYVLDPQWNLRSVPIPESLHSLPCLLSTLAQIWQGKYAQLLKCDLLLKYQELF